MNIGSMLNELISDHYRKSRPAARSTSSSFGEWIVEAAPGQRIVDLGPNHKMIVQENIAPIRIPGPNCIYSGADGLGQSAYVEYTEDSTAEDPVVRITGRSLSGEYDQIVHINDIDPANAAYPELCALMRHLSKTDCDTKSARKPTKRLPCAFSAFCARCKTRSPDFAAQNKSAASDICRLRRTYFPAGI